MKKERGKPILSAIVSKKGTKKKKPILHAKKNFKNALTKSISPKNSEENVSLHISPKTDIKITNEKSADQQITPLVNIEINSSIESFIDTAALNVENLKLPLKKVKFAPSLLSCLDSTISERCFKSDQKNKRRLEQEKYREKREMESKNSHPFLLHQGIKICMIYLINLV